MRVTVVGHVEWVDFIPVARLPQPGEVVHATGAFTRAAGGGGVAAVVLADLGAEVEFFCALGEDDHGRRAAEQLRHRGVNVHVAWRRGQPTRRAVTMLEQGGERTIVTVGERLEPHGSDRLDWGRLRSADGVYFTAGDTAALHWAHEARVLVASPRGRSALDHDTGRPIDALVFSGGDHDEAQWAHRLTGRARLLVETRGPLGGQWSGESEGSWAAADPPGPPRDSYGCGDSFAAAFTYGLASGASIAEAAALGARLGAHALTVAGAP
jgi:ribokinase